MNLKMDEKISNFKKSDIFNGAEFEGFDVDKLISEFSLPNILIVPETD